MIARLKALPLALLAAAGVACVPLALPMAPAMAQSSTPWVTTMQGTPQRKATQQRREAPANPVAVEDEPAVVPPPAGVRADDPDADPNADPQDGDDPARVGLRRNVDGEPQVDAAMLRDGIVETGEPTSAPTDGETPVLQPDYRSAADAEAFERPPAGYDAVAFQIEALDPILDRRPTRLARFEPYDPVGIRKGSWLIFPEIEIGAGWTSNLFRSPVRTSATFFDVRPTVRAITNWRVHAIELKATGLASAFMDNASENDRAYAVEARGRIDLDKRTSLEMLASNQRDQDTRSSRDFPGAAAERGDIVTTRAAIALNHRFNRLSVQLRGGVTDQDYLPVEAVGGGIIENRQRDVLIREAAARATWEFKPTLFAFTEVARLDRAYKEVPADAISRDSQGLRTRVGVAFGNTGRIWRGEVSIGHGTQRPDDARIAETKALLLDANLAWRMSELTSLLFTAKTDLIDSTTTGQSGYVSRQVGLEARHAFQRHLLGTAGVQHTIADYKGSDLVERETIGSLGVEYYASSTLSFTGRYQHIWFDSTGANRDYTVDTIRFGARWRQ